METFIRFWRFIARFSFGLIFFLVIFGLIAKPYFAVLISALTPYSHALLTNVAAFATIAAAGILAASSIGLVLIAVLADGLEALTLLCFGRTRFKNSKPYLTFAPIAELIKVLSLQRKPEFLALIEAQSLAYPGNLNKPKLIARAIQKVSDAIGDRIEASTLQSFAYFGALSQVQSKMDSIQNEVDDLIGLLILGITLALAFNSIAVLGFAIGSTPLVCVLIYRKKHELALFYTSQLYQIFIVNEGGEIADRDSAVT